MAKSTQKFNLYTDGSASQGEHAYGAGSVSLRMGTKKTIRRSYKERKTPLYGRQNSLTTEIYAIVDGLNSLQENSNITLYCDQKTICEKINNKLLEDWTNTVPRKNNKIACKALFNAVSRHNSVYAKHTSVAKSKYLRKAHDLAQEAAFISP